MTRTPMFVLLAAGVASPALAQNTQVLFEASNDSGGSWTRSLDAMPGQDVLVRVRIRLVNTTRPILALAGITFQPTLSNWNPDTDVRLPFSTTGGSPAPDTPATNTGRIVPFGSSYMDATSAPGLLTSHVDNGNTLRFAGGNAATPTTNIAWGVSCGQVPQSIGGTNFRSGVDVVVFRFGVRLGASAPRELVASASLSTILQQRGSWYVTAVAGSLLAPVTQDTIVPATIHIIPAPSVLVTLLCGIATRRRTRSTG